MLCSQKVAKTEASTDVSCNCLCRAAQRDRWLCIDEKTFSWTPANVHTNDLTINLSVSLQLKRLACTNKLYAQFSIYLAPKICI